MDDDPHTSSSSAPDELPKKRWAFSWRHWLYGGAAAMFFYFGAALLLNILVPYLPSSDAERIRWLGPLSTLLGFIVLAGGISFVAGIVGGLAEHAERRQNK
jgi:hypothetical protein